MEMVIPQAVNVQPQAGGQATGQNQSTGSASGTSGTGNGSFQKTLVHQLGGKSSQTAESSKPIVQMVGGSQPAIVDSAATDSATLPSDLLSLIDGLLESLNGDAEKDDADAALEEQLPELESALDQLNALLAILGAPVVIVSQPAVNMEANNEASNEFGIDLNAANVKNGLQDALLQLQALLSQGDLKRVQQQEPKALIGQQLQSLAALLQDESDTPIKQETKQGSASDSLFTPITSLKTETGALLQRLSQQALHPSYVAVAAAQATEIAVESEAGQPVTEQLPNAPITAANAEQAKNAAPIFAKTAPVQYVVAEEFAETMTGLVVQKFDVTSIDGVSEAKLLLFPEHLGQVDVRISMQNGQLTAIFHTDTASAKDMLDNQLAQLRTALQAQGLVVDKLEVSQGGASSQLFGQHNSQGNGHSASGNRQSSKGSGEGSVDEIFETEMVEQVTIQGLGYGRAINVKA
ncbi:flagellar hook-length control protein FliK [Paenibacillus harenae]|uniref:flagellar hook-length control protein FliK n=1 Tax=Paenibacillus harenae TaxID=306543 RepID=UPI00278DECDA|nr:flagellar hook-length control protein FliK [Paenibacillus harenae]MDQ0059664.1 flagellar hook-length control protein FliK [Paenibacillus harenae]